MFSFSCGYTFQTSLIVSRITILSKKKKKSSTDRFEHGRIAVIVCGGSATHPSKSTLRWCSKYPQNTRIRCGKPKCIHPNSLRETEVHRSRHATVNCTFSQAWARSTTKVTAPFHHLFHIKAVLLHFHNKASHAVSLCSSIASFSGIPFHPTSFLPFLNHWCRHLFTPSSGSLFFCGATA